MAERNEHKSAKYQDGDIYLNPCFGDLWVVDGASSLKSITGMQLSWTSQKDSLKLDISME